MLKTSPLNSSNVFHVPCRTEAALKTRESSFKHPSSLGHMIAFLHTFPSYCFLSDLIIFYSLPERKYSYRRLSPWRKRVRYFMIALVVFYGGKFSWPALFSANLQVRVGGLAFTFWNIAIYVSIRVLTRDAVSEVLHTIECLDVIESLHPALLISVISTPKRYNLYRAVEWMIFACWLSWSVFVTFAIDLNLLRVDGGDVLLHVTRIIYGYLRLEMPNVSDSHSLPWYSVFLACIFSGIDIFLILYAYLIDTMALVYSAVFYAAVNGAYQWVYNIAARAHVTAEDLHEIFAVFDRLQVLSDNIKRSVGPVFAALCLAYLPFYCYKFQNVFDANVTLSYPAIAQGIVSVIVIATFLYLSAEAHAKICQIGPSLTMALQKVQFQNTDVRIDCNSRVHVILHNISAGEFGIRSKFISVTYSSVGALVGAVLTYSVIIFQIKNN